MTDSDLEVLYKAGVSESHSAGLRVVYDAGYQAGSGQSVNAGTVDASLTQTLPTTDVTVTTP